MDEKQVSEKVKELLEKSKKRKFVQSIDISVALKLIDLKKTQVNEVYVLPEGRGKKIKTCALVDKQLQTTAKQNCDKVILLSDFDKYKGKSKLIRKLCEKHDVFIAQANIMPQVATVFGKVLGPRNKMPNPRSGSIVPPNADLKPVVARLNNMVYLRARKQPVINLGVGVETMGVEKITKNIMGVMKFLETHLEKGHDNINKVFVKTTMGESIRLL